jgi:hypothetical protein
MSRKERELLDRLRQGWDDTEKLFSREGKPLQERTAVHGLLRVLGIKHADADIIKQGPEPIDVWFGEARFQVTEIMDPARRRDLEIRRSAECARAARRIDDLVEPVMLTSEPMSPQAVLELVVERATEKAEHYGKQCGGIDLLVYLNLRGRHLYPRGPFPPAPDLEAQNWRSVSLIMEHFAIVLSANNAAPEFLRDRVGQGTEWPGFDSVFDWHA